MTKRNIFRKIRHRVNNGLIKKNGAKTMEHKKVTKVKKQIKKKGWTTAELADRWGYSQRRIQQLVSQPTQLFTDAVSSLPDLGVEK